MSVLSWGKPTVEVIKLENGVPPASQKWDKMPEIVTDTTKLNTEQGEKKEAIAEGGDVVDVRYSKSKYTLELELFVKKSDTKPIEDEDGVVLDNYAVRLTPEDEACEGFSLDNTSVSCVETWSSADGKRWKYTFSGLKPKAGKTLKPYTKEAAEAVKAPEAPAVPES